MHKQIECKSCTPIFAFALILMLSYHSNASIVKNESSVSQGGDSSSESNVLYPLSTKTTHVKSKTITKFHYVVGGLAAVWPGFGVGHAIQERWNERGWIHPAIQLGGLLAGLSVLAFRHSPDEWSDKNKFKSFQRETGFLFGAFGLLRVWEAVDVWFLPSHYKIAKEYTGEPISITKKRYITGGIMSIVPGFGIGHAIQGRWWDRGWVFSLWQPFLLFATGSIAGVLHFGSKDAFKSPTFWAIFLAPKIWEVVDAWTLSSHYKYKIVKDSFQIRPFFTYHNQDNYGLGLSFSYKF